MKREPVDDEREQNRWLGNALRQPPSAADDTCCDAETLAAWASGSLDAKAAAAVELHASNCPRCTAVLAAMERSAPLAPSASVWTSSRVLRWLVPLTAAATAVAIWIAVPDRPVTSDSRSATEQVQVPVPVPGAEPVPMPAPAPDAKPRTENQNPAPRTQNLEPPQERVDLRDEFRRERAAPEAAGAAAAPEPAQAPSSSAPIAPNAPVQPSAPPPTAVEREQESARTLAADSLAETVTTTSQRGALNKAAAKTESMAPGNRQIRWRVVAPGRIERSTNGAKSWTATKAPPGSLATIRAVDGDRAVVRTSDNTEFYTTDAGRSWTRVQENSVAPF